MFVEKKNYTPKILYLANENIKYGIEIELGLLHKHQSTAQIIDCNPFKRKRLKETNVIDVRWQTLAKRQKSAILSCHIRHKMPWRCHLSQIGHGDYKKNMPLQSVMADIRQHCNI